MDSLWYPIDIDRQGIYVLCWYQTRNICTVDEEKYWYMSWAPLAIWYGNSTLSSNISMCITCCIPALSFVSRVISMHAVVVHLFSFCVTSWFKGERFLLFPLGGVLFSLLEKEVCTLCFACAMFSFFVFMIVAHVYWFVKSRGSFGTSWPLGGVRLFFAYLVLFSPKLILS